MPNSPDAGAVPGLEAEPGERRFHWVWMFPDVVPEALWPLLSDTDLFNRLAGLPAMEQRAEPGQDGAEWRRLGFRALGMDVEWLEHPFEWERPRWFGVRRDFLKGPIRRVRTRVLLAPEIDGTRVDYHLFVAPRNVLGRILVPLQFGIRLRRRFRAAASQLARLAGGAPVVLPPAPRSPTDAARLSELQRELAAAGANPAVLEQLDAMLRTAADMDLGRMQPWRLARAWGLPRRAVLETMLTAARTGMLEARWEVLCPACQGSKQSVGQLADLRPSGVHCADCRIDFDAEFDRSVELVFRPHPSIRRVEPENWCLGSPQRTAHIAMQRRLAPGGDLRTTLELDPGRWRLRRVGRSGEWRFSVEAGGASTPVIDLALGEPSDAIDTVAPRASWTWRHRGAASSSMPEAGPAASDAAAGDLWLRLERTAWLEDVVTAAEVTTNQRFRDLFASEALRPGEQVSVGWLVVVFTDLRGSTRMYREIGDAPAFGRVLGHFDVLREAVDEAGGAVVKTIGDAVMAAFTEPLPAVQAFWNARQRLRERDDGLVLRVGIHAGPCIAVTLNGRLDYFGTTVNLAARLEGQSGGQGIVLSGRVHDNPRVQTWLREQPDLVAETFDGVLKGFEDQPQALWRIREAD